MNKIKSFFIGLILLITTFIVVLLAALVYRANERTSVKSYIFQMGNFANQRVGTLQDINEISTNDLRNKLIKKYVSEYFKVIPGEADVTKRPVLYSLGENTFEQWKKTEAKTIADMSAKKMFRMVRVSDDGIMLLNKQDIKYSTKDEAESVYYEVRYRMATWMESNRMETEPIYDQGTIYLEARFKPGIKPGISVRKYLEEGEDPVGLFMFEVTNIGNKER